MIQRDDFRFNSGRLSLDLSGTIRRRASDPEDVLAPPGAPASWLKAAMDGDRVLSLSPREEDELRSLREAIWMAADAAASRRELPSKAVARLNEAASRPLPIPQIDPKTGQIKQVAQNAFDASLSTIARDAVELLGTPLREHIKTCEQPDCQMLFVDLSPSSRRRWCSMDRCGSRAKGDAFRKRQKISNDKRG
jgi:predicted RNA-binding Zn ribbon-like protein